MRFTTKGDFNMKNIIYNNAKRWVFFILSTIATSMSALSDITPAIKWGDVPPNEFLTNVAAKAGISGGGGGGGGDIPLESFLYVSNRVDDIEEAIDEILDGGGGTDPEAWGDKKIAMFIIDVNVGANAATNTTTYAFSGFELKATTNNFDLASTENVKLQFYAQSEIADTGAAPPTAGIGIDKMRMYICSDVETSETRRYTRIQNTVAISQFKLTRVVVLVDASCLIRHPEDNAKWLNEDNEELIWCYHRNRLNDNELIPGTDKPLWKPTMPVKWFKKVPHWAE